MNSFGFNGLNNNPLAPFLQQYLPSQTEPTQATNEPARTNSGGVSAFEINSQSELEYIVPDKSGRKQIVDCPLENKVYIGRYNHVRQVMDWRSYIDEGEVSLFQKNDTSAEMSKIAEALVAVANKLDNMQSEIQELKSVQTKEESTRRPNGQFKKKGE